MGNPIPFEVLHSYLAPTDNNAALLQFYAACDRWKGPYVSCMYTKIEPGAVHHLCDPRH